VLSDSVEARDRTRAARWHNRCTRDGMVVYEQPVRTRAGRVMVGVCAAIGAAGLITALSTFAGATFVWARWWQMAIGVAGVAGAVVAHRARCRLLQIVRDGEVHRLVVAGSRIDLAFPLRIGGTQVRCQVKRDVYHEVWLELVAAGGGGIALVETRGPREGPVLGWFEGMVTGLWPAPFHVIRVGGIAELLRYTTLLRQQA
jgi:hypothetical protein